MIFKIIPTSMTGVVQTFGKFSYTVRPGLNLFIPFIQKITPVSNRLQQRSVHLQVKTRDNVLTNLGIDIQFKVKAEDTQLSFFSLDDPVGQMDAFVKNEVRSRVPKMKLDELFESPDEISNAINEKLAPRMLTHGFTIENTLLTTIDPDASVMKAMNQINASERLKEAAKNEAEADYIKQVRHAEADRDRKRLQGEGISQQRQEIMKGYSAGVSDMSKNFGMDHRQIVEFVLRTQHLDTIENVGKSPNTKVIFLNHTAADNPLLDTLVKHKES
jgi:regulator of protease activity HflC (stomatin/prohibitin superfamily)